MRFERGLSPSRCATAVFRDHAVESATPTVANAPIVNLLSSKPSRSRWRRPREQQERQHATQEHLVEIDVADEGPNTDLESDGRQQVVDSDEEQ